MRIFIEIIYISIILLISTGHFDMRILLNLQPVNYNYSLPINYYHPMSSAIYTLFRAASPEFSEWLHEHGFLTSEGRPMKLFNFSRLDFRNYRIDNNIIRARGNLRMKFSTPLGSKIGQKFIQGLFNSGVLRVHNRFAGEDLTVSSVETLPEPLITTDEVFIMQSPTAVSTVINKNGDRKIYYYRPDDDNAERALERNLMNKYELLRKKPYSGKLAVRLDRDYIARAGRRATKLIAIREGMRNEMQIKAFVCPLRIEGDPEIIKIAYDCGVGEKNSMGFGFIERNN